MADPPTASLKDDDRSSGEAPEEAKSESDGEVDRKEMTVVSRAVKAATVDAEIEDLRKCKYRDYSHIKAPEGAPPVPRRNPANKESTFPQKLHVIISSPEFWEISWLPHGRSWRINNPKSFEERVIPIFFRHGRYTSFARQVNGWGFRRITHGSDFNSYYHELFLRGMPHLCERMRRLTNKDSGARKKAEEEKTPDLAAISKEHPLPDDIPMLPASAVAAHAVQPPGVMDSYLGRLSDNGGVDSYLSSLSDAEIAFLARRQMAQQQMFGSPNPLLGADPRAAAMNPGMMPPPGMGGLAGMGPSPAMAAAMKGDPRAASLASPGARPPAGRGVPNPNAASMPPGPAQPPQGAGMDGPGARPNPRASLTPPRNNGQAQSSGASANPNGSRPPPQQQQQQQGGNPAVEQYLHQASDNQLAQLIAMHDAAAMRRRQQMQQQPPY